MKHACGGVGGVPSCSSRGVKSDGKRLSDVYLQSNVGFSAELSAEIALTTIKFK